MQTQEPIWVSCGPTEEDMGAVVKYIREKMLDLNLKPFADKVRIAPYRIAKWEEGDFRSRAPVDRLGLAVIRKIAETFDLDIEIIITKKT